MLRCQLWTIGSYWVPEYGDRVHPAHVKKFAAALQACNTSANPILLRVETKAGHGAGKPTTKQIEENADLYGFVMDRLGMPMTSLGAAQSSRSAR